MTFTRSSSHLNLWPLIMSKSSYTRYSEVIPSFMSLWSSPSLPFSHSFLFAFPLFLLIPATLSTIYFVGSVQVRIFWKTIFSTRIVSMLRNSSKVREIDHANFFKDRMCFCCWNVLCGDEVWTRQWSAYTDLRTKLIHWCL